MGGFSAAGNALNAALEVFEDENIMSNSQNGPLRVWYWRPVRHRQNHTDCRMWARPCGDKWSIGVNHNDIYTVEDADALVQLQALSADRIMGVATGGSRIRPFLKTPPSNLHAIRVR